MSSTEKKSKKISVKLLPEKNETLRDLPFNQDNSITHQKPSQQSHVGKDTNGRFVKGHKLSVGNRGNTSIWAKQLKEVFISQIKIDDLKAICLKMIEQAKGGDADARKELFDRLWGKSVQPHDLTDNMAWTIADIFAQLGTNGNGDT